MSKAQKKPQAIFEIEESGQTVTGTLSGDWSCGAVGAADRKLRELGSTIGGKSLHLDASRVERFDTSGAWLLRRLQTQVDTSGGTFSLTSADNNHIDLFNAISSVETITDRPKRGNPVTNFVSGVGEAMYGFRNDALLGLNIIGASIRGPQLKAKRRGGLRLTSIFHHMDHMGVRAIPIIVLMSFLIGIIIAQQGAQQLKWFGAELLMIDLVGILLLREIGVLLTAIMVAGRTGSAITAEIGSMKMREEVDALQVMGLNPVGVLVYPRLVALIIVLPILTIVSNISGLLGAMTVSYFYIDASPQLFYSKLLIAVDNTTIISGMLKAPFMALVIGVISAAEGFKVAGSAESLGHRTTAAVVKSIFFVIVIDGIFAIFYGAVNF
ncbi:MAG: MlaE family lipid ABC transporter permease subunit [Pseudomonadota bacterium]